MDIGNLESFKASAEGFWASGRKTGLYDSSSAGNSSFILFVVEEKMKNESMGCRGVSVVSIEFP